MPHKAYNGREIESWSQYCVSIAGMSLASREENGWSITDEDRETMRNRRMSDQDNLSPLAIAKEA